MRKKPHIVAIIPCLDKRGGVRHFLEIGNELVSRGYRYTIYSDDPSEKLDWFSFKGELVDWKYVFEIVGDIVIIGDPYLLPLLDQGRIKGKPIVWVIADGPYRKLYQPYRGKYPFLVINRWFLKHYPEAKLCELGVNTQQFRPKDRLILFYSGGTRGLHKQGHVIHRALSGIPNLRLYELNGLTNDQLAAAYQTGDYFVAWEKEGGFSNTAAEALASGLPVVTNGNNCEPFLEKCILVKDEKELRRFFSDPMGGHTWKKTVDRLLEILRDASLL